LLAKLFAQKTSHAKNRDLTKDYTVSKLNVRDSRYLRIQSDRGNGKNTRNARKHNGRAKNAKSIT